MRRREIGTKIGYEQTLTKILASNLEVLNKQLLIGPVQMLLCHLSSKWPNMAACIDMP